MEIDFDVFDRDQLKALVLSYQGLVDLMLESNSTLAIKLLARGDTNLEHAEIINGWSLFNNQLQEHHGAHVDRFGKPVN